MNKERRANLAKAQSLIEQALELLEGARDEEQDYFDNMPERLQGSDKGDAAETAVANLEEAIGQLEEARDNVEAAAN